MTAAYRAVFRCIAGCPGDHPLDAVLYRCPRCGDLLEVAHDMAALAGRSAAEWMKLFDDRFMRTQWPYGSGVWGKKEWVAPHIRDENVVSMWEGGSNLLWGGALRRPARARRPLGQAVRQLAHRIVQGPRHDGPGLGGQADDRRRRRIPAIACASTGDTSAALAAYAAAAGLRAVVLLPRGKVSTAQLVQPLANGALVLAVDSDFDGCMRIVAELADRDGVYLANSMNSLRLEGQKTVAIEIAQQFDWAVPDWVIIPGGNLGNVSALVAGFSMMCELGLCDRIPRVCVAQAERANPLYRSFETGFRDFAPVAAQPTLASAIQIGDPVSRDRAIRAIQRCGGVVEQAGEAELADAAARADRTGMFSCPHTGVALAALEKLVARGQVERGQRVVVVSTANGLKFTDFKVRYHERDLPGVPAPQHACQPVPVACDYAAVREVVLRHID